MSTIILAQYKKFQNCFWTTIRRRRIISLYIRLLGEEKDWKSINQISDRTLSFEFKNAWKILAFRNAEAQSAEASKAEFSENESWLRLLNEIRTFFEENPETGF